MTIRNDTEKWVFVLFVSLVSVAGSLLITRLMSPGGLDIRSIVPAVAVPMIVAPMVSLWVARMMLRIHQLNRQLEFLLRHDQMTGLLSRAAFIEQLENQDMSGPGTVMMIDIDRFKAINDTFGHQTGDRVIRTVSQILQEKSQPDGAAARFGGEEFVTYFPGACVQHAELRAEAIRAAVESQTIQVDGRELSCTLSIGVDTFDGTRPLDQVLRAADEALYEAKNTGRNRVVRHDERATETG
ncbi:GGDEF domain-containing protein [Sedimentitalea sp. HM32M-2]|uniref:GGDEF domain-containing protein n=1 Tax=Sedimentitalea sp. HM32M-2 TaxID=3351566 RepID=UPI00363616EE